MPLREINLDDIQDLFIEEVQHWREQLYWDYEPTTNVVRDFIASHSLPGFVLRSAEDRVVGYSYFVIDRPIGFVGDMFVSDHHATKETYGLLLGKTVEVMKQLYFVERIESQIFPLNCSLVQIFEPLGFQTPRRYFLRVELEGIRGIEPAPIPGFRLVEWQRDFIEAASETMYDSYLSSPDRGLCRDYGSQAGCFRFLRNLIENPACGEFSPQHTVVAIDENDTICGILLATKISPDTGMVPQISVKNDYQGQGLGSVMLRSFMLQGRQAGLKRITLSVSEANQRAFELYRRLGFEVVKEFNAFLWQKSKVGDRLRKPSSEV